MSDDENWNSTLHSISSLTPDQIRDILKAENLDSEGEYNEIFAKLKDHLKHNKERRRTIFRVDDSENSTLTPDNNNSDSKTLVTEQTVIATHSELQNMDPPIQTPVVTTANDQNSPIVSHSNTNLQNSNLNTGTTSKNQVPAQSTPNYNVPFRTFPSNLGIPNPPITVFPGYTTPLSTTHSSLANQSMIHSPQEQRYVPPPHNSQFFGHNYQGVGYDLPAAQAAYQTQINNNQAFQGAGHVTQAAATAARLFRHF